MRIVDASMRVEVSEVPEVPEVPGAVVVEAASETPVVVVRVELLRTL